MLDAVSEPPYRAQFGQAPTGGSTAHRLPPKSGLRLVLSAREQSAQRPVRILSLLTPDQDALQVQANRDCTSVASRRELDTVITIAGAAGRAQHRSTVETESGC